MWFYFWRIPVIRLSTWFPFVLAVSLRRRYYLPSSNDGGGGMTIGQISNSSVAAAAAPPPGGQPTYLWDTELRGFGLKVLPSGRKVYLVQYAIGGRKGRTRRITIGRHGRITPAEARK